MLGNTPNQPTKFKTKTWVQIHDHSRGIYNANSQNKFKTSMSKSILCDYSDAHKLVSGIITVAGLAAGGGNNSIEVVFKTVLHLLIA